MPPPDASSAPVADLFGGRVRVRVCGLLREGNALLMVCHRGLGPSGTFWSPPGGGIEFGESAAEALRREMAEETGLHVAVGRLVCVSEYVVPPLHAVDLFFEVRQTGGQLLVGTDPEMAGLSQLITDVRLLTFEEIKALPATDVHTLFSRCHSLDELFQLTGYFNQL